MNNYPLSIIIITKNEQETIRDCLESVSWAKEIIILDSGSTDLTESICREYTDKFFIKDWPGFGEQKQRALDLASQMWVFSIDADERLTSDLKEEIISIIESDRQESGFYVPRLSHYLGKEIRYAGWYPDYVIRLVRSQKARFTDDKIHERIILDGKVGRLSSHMLHYPYKNIEHHIQKINLYSSISALILFEKGKRISWAMIFTKSMFSFLRSYFIKRGFLGGWVGLIVSCSSAISVYLKYLKLKEHHRKKNKI